MISPFDGLDIKKNTIVAKYNCSITIDPNEYDEKSFDEASDKIHVPCVLDIYFPEFDDICNLVMPYSVNVIKTQNMLIDKSGINISYQVGDIIIQQEYYDDDVDLGLLSKIMRGNIKYTSDPKVLLNLLHNILSSVDLVQYELILANMFRLKDNEDEKCRYTGNYKDAQIIGIREQVFIDSWNSALAFQNMDKAIAKSLVKHKPAEMNPIEKILNEDYKSL